MKSKLQESIALARCIGKQESLVQARGGNVSVKEGNRLWITASGCRLEEASASSFVCLDLKKARAKTEEAEANSPLLPLLESGKRDPRSPSPSVETPVHALIPSSVVVHVHDTASLVMSGVEKSRLFLDEAGFEDVFCLPFTISGLPLAKRIASLRLDWEAYSALLLEHHGLFLWGEHADVCWTKLQDYLDKCEKVIAAKMHRDIFKGCSPAPLSSAEKKERIELCIGFLSEAMPYPERAFFFIRDDPLLSRFLDLSDLKRLTRKGMATAEHLVDVRYPLIVDGRMDREKFCAKLQNELQGYEKRYRAYFQRFQEGEAMHLPYPNIFLVRGVGMLAAGASKEEARDRFICYKQTAEVLMKAEKIGEFSFLPEQVQFEIEYFRDRVLS